MSRLPNNYEFDFLDAEVPMPPAPGVASYHPGPFLAWYRRHFADDVTAALEMINRVIEEDGPYDGIIGFSEGAAAAASVLLAPPDGSDEPPRFKFAVFICSVIPFSPSSEVGIDDTEYALNYEKASLEFFGVPLEEIDATPTSKRIYVYKPLSGKDKKAAGAGCQNRISIPTLHLLGAKDPFLPFGHYVASLCDGRKSTVVSSPCGHELPRNEDTLDKIASLFESVYEMSRFDF